MAAEAEIVQIIHTPQEIYEISMNSASFKISTLAEFNIKEISIYMKELYIKYTTKQQTINSTRIIEGYYELRDSPDALLITPIDEIEYKGLSMIFDSKINSMLNSNKDNPFVSECNESVKCTENENKVSTLNYDNVKNHNPIFNIKVPNTMLKQSRCKKCFKFSPNVAGFKFTNAMLNKWSNSQYSQLKNNEKKGKIVKRRKELNFTNKYGKYNQIQYKIGSSFMTIHITLPNGQIIPTSELLLQARHSESTFKRYYGYLIYSIAVLHTRPVYSAQIIAYISEIWPFITNEKDCYIIHWLLAVACPFKRGSAGFAKVMLNAALWKIGLPPVKETAEYTRKTDWVAILSSSFEEYSSKKEAMLEIDDIALQQMQKIQHEQQKEQVQEKLANTNKGGKRKSMKKIRR